MVYFTEKESTIADFVKTFIMNFPEELQKKWIDNMTVDGGGPQDLSKFLFFNLS